MTETAISKCGVKQVGGNHYDMPYQAIDFIMENRVDYVRGCILKYLVRAPAKGGTEDMDKALSLLPALRDFASQPDAVNEFCERNQNQLNEYQQAAIMALFSRTAPSAAEPALLRLKIHLMQQPPRPRRPFPESAGDCRNDG